jgi:hypothetical protein
MLQTEHGYPFFGYGGSVRGKLYICALRIEFCRIFLVYLF